MSERSPELEDIRKQSVEDALRESHGRETKALDSAQGSKRSQLLSRQQHEMDYLKAYHQKKQSLLAQVQKGEDAALALEQEERTKETLRFDDNDWHALQIKHCDELEVLRARHADEKKRFLEANAAEITEQLAKHSPAQDQLDDRMQYDEKCLLSQHQRNKTHLSEKHAFQNEYALNRHARARAALKLKHKQEQAAFEKLEEEEAMIVARMQLQQREMHEAAHRGAMEALDEKQADEMARAKAASDVHEFVDQVYPGKTKLPRWA
ncbi:hypothetical protein SDRG_10378 [Saprolegnia diclina VS20]|uniref:Uncharacterized protein n=1 Tax=Saprolegnia diclina (strain VS20) TaxID=1156394 RepID=T0QF06_SAPDV|nr:hypothetical protein SDRG_10378 [Saprolegnia diclina VS20]EQC32185.1 hypothetical protein SDRG_10378 [Saprolegnia diclina VS20]|eukprot:XP_008614587.1 hypothetical protein SDRG_10378 [Saprolegnia diclina VS20]